MRASDVLRFNLEERKCTLVGYCEGVKKNNVRCLDRVPFDSVLDNVSGAVQAWPEASSVRQCDHHRREARLIRKCTQHMHRPSAN